MGNKITDFEAASGETGGVLIHIEELLVFRYQLDLSPLALERDTISSPSGRFIGVPPTWDDAVQAIQLSFDDSAVEAIHQFHLEYEPKPLNLPKTIEVNGISHLLPLEALEKSRVEQERFEQGRYSFFVKTVFGVVDQVLDKQFPFLPSIDGVGLKESLSTIPVGGVVDEDYLASRRAMGGELFNACRENIRRHVGSDWALVKYDQGLAHNVRLATRQNLEIYEAGFQP